MGRIDIVVGNAAINPHYGSFTDISDDAFAKVMATNVQSNLWLAQLVAGEMRVAARTARSSTCRRSGGQIGIGRDTAPTASPRPPTSQLVRNLAVELGPHNIRVNAIAPGLVRTDFRAAPLWEDEEGAAARIAADAAEAAGASRRTSRGSLVYLASDAGRWTTGQSFVVDGGPRRLRLEPALPRHDH